MSLNKDYCACCGAKFNEDYTISGLNPYYASYPNSLFDGKICMWCANNVEYSIVCLSLDNYPTKNWVSQDGRSWSKENLSEWPEIADRRKVLKGLGIQILVDYVPYGFSNGNKICPRCATLLVKKDSVSLLGDKYSVLKCENCGYCN